MKRWILAVLATCGLAACAGAGNEPTTNAEVWQEWALPGKAELAAVGRNPYFILEPGYQLLLETKDGDRLIISVLNETKVVDGVETRVVEEHETEGGKLLEISRNYFAIAPGTRDVYYFGEDVDMYKDGKVTGHAGSWLAGVNGAKAGLMFPGSPKAGQKFMQEMAAKVAMDRCEIVSTSESVTVPAGKLTGCMKVADSSALEPGPPEVKIYAPEVGLAVEENFRLVKYGVGVAK